MSKCNHCEFVKIVAEAYPNGMTVDELRRTVQELTAALADIIAACPVAEVRTVAINVVTKNLGPLVTVIAGTPADPRDLAFKETVH